MRGHQPVETLDVLGGRTDAMLIHVAARDPLGTRGHTNLVALPIVANHLTHGEGSVVLRIDGRRGLVDGGGMPAVTVVGVISRRNYFS